MVNLPYGAAVASAIADHGSGMVGIFNGSSAFDSVSLKRPHPYAATK
jgi:hypothetical protein